MSNEQPPVPLAATTPVPPSPPGISLIGAVVLSALCSLASVTAFAFLFHKQAPGAQQVVVLDAEKIAAARMDKLLADNLPADQAAKEGERFAEEMRAELARYTEAGVVVVNARVALNRPEALDITADVANALGLAVK